MHDNAQTLNIFKRFANEIGAEFIAFSTKFENGNITPMRFVKYLPGAERKVTIELATREKHLFEGIEGNSGIANVKLFSVNDEPEHYK